jgi:hypothetical protein
MLSGKQIGETMEKAADLIIAEAIRDANITHPGAGDGTTHLPAYRSNEEVMHLTKIIVEALTKAGYEIIKKAAQDA